MRAFEMGFATSTSGILVRGNSISILPKQEVVDTDADIVTAVEGDSC